MTYIVEVEPQDRERRADNNRLVRTIHVRKEKLKVLFVEGYPRYEYRYLKNFLEREETVDLGVVLLSADPEYSEQDLFALPTFPASKDDLFQYDVVILGDADPSFLSASQMANLREFVTEKGGGMLFVAGEEFNPLAYKGTPLEPLLPIQLAEARNPTAVGNAVAAFRPRLTPEGRASPIFRFGDDEATSIRVWENLPELFWFLEAPRKQPAAFVLAEHPTLRGADGARCRSSCTSSSGRARRCSTPWTTPGAGGSASPTATSAATGSRASGSSPARSRRPAAGGDHHRPRDLPANQPVQIRVRFPNPGRAPAGPRSTSRSSAGEGAAQRRPAASAGGTERLRGGPAPAGDRRVRGPAAARRRCWRGACRRRSSASSRRPASSSVCG